MTAEHMANVTLRQQRSEERSSVAALSVPRVLERQAKRTPDSIAIVAPGRDPLTYSRLRLQIEDTVKTLNALGVGRRDRVAMVVPNGPEMAVAFLAVASAAISLPLNPAYRGNEFDFYLSDLNAKALVLQSGIDSPARAVAQARGISIIELSPILNAEAGLFTLTGETHSYTARDDGFAQPDDLALVLHTSGSTSRPKIVPLTHANICTAALNIGATLELGDKDRCLNVMPLFHIHGLSALLSSMAAGARMVCPPGFYAPKFFAWMEEFRPTWYTAAPTIHQAILERAAPHGDIIARCALRFIRSASAAMPLKVMADLESVFTAPFIEAYGMTEAAHQIASNPLPPRERKPGSVGVAAGPDVAIIDEAGTLLQPGETGEVVIRGANVMQGYEHNPAANKSAFTNGWFRTGDGGYLDDDGYLFITGRLKEIINRGGEKISPREVDEVLLNHPAIAYAVTFAVPHTKLGEDVAAAIVLREDASVTEREIREFAALRLADFKVPRQVLIVDEIPKGHTGKLQRIGLADKLGLTLPEQATPDVNAEFTAPHTPIEEVLAELWSEVLGVEPVSIHDDFFQLGGDSILAAHLVSRVREAMQVELSLISLFETPTIAGLAESIETTHRAEHCLQAPPVRPVSRDGALPLSFAQQRLWFLDQWEPANSTYNTSAAFRLIGPLNVGALERSLNEIVRRHDALRTTFPSVDGQPVQAIAPVLTLSLPAVDLRNLPEPEREAEVQRLMGREAQRPFDLARGPLLRSTLLWMDDQEHMLLLAMHHIISDGWSRGVLFRELSILYEAFFTGGSSPLPEPAIQYADFAVWQRQWLQGEILESQLSYWRQQFDGAPLVLELPTDRPRPPIQTAEGARQSLVLPKRLAESLLALSHQQHVTLFMTLLAAFKTLLYRYTGQEDILVGTPVANRNRVELEGLIGLFANTLVLRTTLSGNPTFRELLGRVRDVALGAYAHQDLPFEKLVEELQPQRSLARHPLFQVMFVLQNAPRRGFNLAGLTLTPFEIDRETAMFDLSLLLTEEAEGWRATLGYNIDLFDAATMRRMLEHFQTLLEGIVANPDHPIETLPLLTPAERHRVTHEWNQTRRDYPADKCIHQLFERRAETSPEQIALVHGEREVTYGEVNRRSNQLARYLQRMGVGPESLVAVCLDRSPELVIAIVAILKAGGAFVSLPADSSSERLEYLLQDTGAEMVITKEALVDRLERALLRLVCIDSQWNQISLEDTTTSESSVRPENLAYAVYTSGSTGRPKGILITHRSLVNYATAVNQIYDFSAMDRRLQFAPTSSEVFISEVFGALVSGATVVLRPDQDFASFTEFLKFVEANNISVFGLPSAFWHEWVASMSDGEARLPGCLRIVISGMDKARPELFEVWKQKVGGRIRWFNVYGPSEATCVATLYEADFSTPDRLYSIPIGRPIANARIYLLDRHQNPVPVGVPGELYIGGYGVGRGYLHLPELTADKFVPDTFSDDLQDRLYRTGDLARYLPDGNIEFLGRSDYQVKIRGFRVELEEIEAILRQHPGVREAVVVAREDVGIADWETANSRSKIQNPKWMDKRLAAYIVANSHDPASIIELRRFLREKLPAYMIPSAFMILEALPLTSSGKVDRGALPMPDATRPEVEEPFAAPATPIEEALARIWGEALGLQKIGVYDNFLDLGGHSLSAMNVIFRVEAELGVRLSPRDFVMQTLGQIATICEQPRVSLPTSETKSLTQKLWGAMKRTAFPWI